MKVKDYLQEDKFGYYLDARDVLFNWLSFNEVSVIKIKLLKKDWYCIPQFAKAIHIQPNSKQLAKKLNKVKDGTAVRIHIFGHKIMWFATENGLHQIFDDSIDINQLNLPI